MEAFTQQCDSWPSVLVLTSPQLFPAIQAFLPGHPRWLAALERKQDSAVDELKLTLEAKRGAGAPGLLPFLAIQQRDLRVLERLWVLHNQPQFRKSSKYWFHSAMHDAATIGNLEALEWLYEKMREMCEPSAVSLAAMHGHADVVRWLLAHLPAYDLGSAQHTMVKTASSGRLEVLKVFYEWRKDACTAQMMDLAASGGHLEVVQFLHEHGDAGCSTAAVDGAAENGHQEVVKWLLANRDEGFTDAALRGAVANGHVEVVKFLWDVRRPEDTLEGQDETFVNAMRFGVRDAIRKNHAEVLRFVYAAVGDSVFPPYTLSLATQAHCDLDLFGFLYSVCPSRDDRDDAIVEAIWDVPILEFLLKHDSFTTAALDKAVRQAEAGQEDPEIFAPAKLALQIAIARQSVAETASNAFAVEPTRSSVAYLATRSSRSRLKLRLHVRQRLAERHQLRLQLRHTVRLLADLLFQCDSGSPGGPASRTLAARARVMYPGIYLVQHYQ